MPESQQSPFSAHRKSGSSVDPCTEPPADPPSDSSVGRSPHQLQGAIPRGPLSPQPSRPAQPALTRQFSKSAPSSPQDRHAVSFNPSRHPSDSFPDTPPESTAHTLIPSQHAKGEDARKDGAMQIPGRAGQHGMQGSQLTGASLEGPVGGSLGGSERGSLGPLHGVSPPDGYMADSELAASSHRLHHSSVSFSDSGLFTCTSSACHALPTMASSCTHLSQDCRDTGICLSVCPPAFLPA